MKIKLITPASNSGRNGNRVTALRYARILKRLGHRLTLDHLYDGQVCDLMIALHARRSSESIRKFREQYPESPLIVVLTGTDLYRDIHTSPAAQGSLKLATLLVVLQKLGVAELPKEFHGKTRIIYQSADKVRRRIMPPSTYFKVCVIGHLRPEKDPFRAAMAVRQLPSGSRMRVFHIGRALSSRTKEIALRENATNPRYRWVVELPHWQTRRLLASSHLLALTSRIEGGSNVLCEAIASSTPVVASKISGLMGTLGENYPGYFPVGDTARLAELFRTAESDEQFYEQLKLHCIRLAPLVTPERERASWKQLLEEL